MFRPFTIVKVVFIKLSIIATSRVFFTEKILADNVLTNIANSIYPDQTDPIGPVEYVSTLIESILSTEWQCLKNKTGMYKAITILKCVMLLTLTCRNLSTDIYAVTWLLHRLNYPRFSESLKLSKFPRD